MPLSDIFERLDRWVGYRPESRGLTPQQVWGSGADEWFDRPRAGAPVDFESVMGIQHVWSCVSLLVNDVRKLPTEAYRKADKRRIPIAKPGWMTLPDPLDPNTRFRDHVGQAVLSLLVDGNAFLHAWPSVFNVERLTLLDPSKVDVLVDGRFRVLGQPQPLTSMNVRHIANLVPPGKRRGMNPIQATREGFSLTIQAEAFGQTFFANGATMSGIVEVPVGSVVDPKELKKAMERDHRGVSRSHALGVLTGGATFRQLSFSPEDTQFIALRKYQLEDAARLFHVPPFKIGSTDPGAVAYASTSNARIDYVQSAIEPIVVLLEDAYSDLLPGDDTFVRFNLNALLRGDPVTRSQSLNTQAQAGVITKQEWRDLEDYGPADEAPGVDSVHGGYLQTPNNTATEPTPDDSPDEPPPQRSLPRPAEDDEMRALTVNVNQPDVAEALREMRQAAEESRRMAVVMEERAERAEARIAELVAREQPAPVVTIEAPAPVVIPAPIVENRVDVPVGPAPAVTVNVPARQTVDIASLPPLKAKVRRDSTGRMTGIEE